jgi:hypothetical protein
MFSEGKKKVQKKNKGKKSKVNDITADKNLNVVR